MNDHIRKEIYRMWEEGLNSFHISATLGITRNSVMGVVNRGQRMGVVKRRGVVGRKPSEPKAQTPKVERLPKKTPLTTIQPVKLKKEEKPVPVVVPPPSYKKQGPKTITELGTFDCRWILPDKKYCGQYAASAKNPWCPDHYKMVYVKGTGFARKRA